MIINSKKQLSLGMLAMLLVKISFGSTFKKNINHLKVWILKHLNIGKNCLQKNYCCTVFLIRLMLKKLNYENFKVGSITIFMLKFPMMVRNTYLQDAFSQKKFVNWNKTTKAGLVAGGFEEDHLAKLHTDSPTCGK